MRKDLLHCQMYPVDTANIVCFQHWVNRNQWGNFDKKLMLLLQLCLKQYQSDKLRSQKYLSIESCHCNTRKGIENKNFYPSHCCTFLDHMDCMNYQVNINYTYGDLVAEEKNPCSHAVQLVLDVPATVEYVPMTLRNIRISNIPDGQCVHFVAPASEYVPGSQSWHCIDPFMLLNFDASHNVQAAGPV